MFLSGLRGLSRSGNNNCRMIFEEINILKPLKFLFTKVGFLGSLDNNIPVKSCHNLTLLDTLDFLLNEYFIKLNTANFNILNKVNTLRGSPQSLSYCKCIKQNKIYNVVDRCLARYRPIDWPLSECSNQLNAIPYNSKKHYTISL